MVKYLIGDATYPQGEGKKIIAHICNDVGGFGAGFVVAVSRRWKLPEKAYCSVPINKLMLGNVQFIDVEPDIIVANMIAQDGVRKKGDIPSKCYVSYGALRVTLNEVNDLAYRIKATIHCPRIGAGLGGGDWKVIEKIIEETCSVDVFVYDLK